MGLDGMAKGFTWGSYKGIHPYRQQLYVATDFMKISSLWIEFV